MRTATQERGEARGLYAIKPMFVRALEPATRHAASLGISPSQVTAAAIPVEFATVIVLVTSTRIRELLLIVPVLALVWMALNAIDGALARSTGHSTARGAALNELVDRLGDLLLIGAAFIIAPAPVGAIVAIGILTSELVAALEWAIIGSRVFVGPMGKPDRVATVAVGSILTILWAPALIVAFVIIGVASCIGTIVRTRHLLAAANVRDEWGAS